MKNKSYDEFKIAWNTAFIRQKQEIDNKPINEFPRLNIKTTDLMETVNGFLQCAYANHKEDFHGIDWEYIGVADITYRLSMMNPDDGPYCVVTVDGASPDNRLRKWVQNKLDETKLYPNTFIELDW